MVEHELDFDSYSDLEKRIRSTIKILMKNSQLPDNFYDVVVDIYKDRTFDYLICNVTFLMKNAFTHKESDQIRKILDKIIPDIKSFFGQFFGSITSSTTALYSYNNMKWFYDERK